MNKIKTFDAVNNRGYFSFFCIILTFIEVTGNMCVPPNEVDTLVVGGIDQTHSPLSDTFD